MVAAVDRSHTHAYEERHAQPKKPSPITPRRENRNHGTGNMRRGKSSAAHAAEVFDQPDQRCAVTTRERGLIERGKRVKGALDREQNRDDVNTVMRECRGAHNGPESCILAICVEQGWEDHKVEKVCHVRKLHEVVERRVGKLPEPNRRMNAEQGVIENNEVRIKPSVKNSVNQTLEFFEEENVKRQGIPMTSEVQ
ncbi:MAG TPA: hypothetical protein VMB47_08525 [Candidatus Aquilonibacter sp.]|nr:hypothetical protein [Candidatus Aquilonibacter sp.]